MSVTDTRVADGVQDGQVVLELIDLCFDTLCNATWAILVIESLGQLVNCAPHVADLCVNLLSVQILEGTCTAQPKVNHLKSNVNSLLLLHSSFYGGRTSIWGVGGGDELGF